MLRTITKTIKRRLSTRIFAVAEALWSPVESKERPDAFPNVYPFKQGD